MCAVRGESRAPAAACVTQPAVHLEGLEFLWGWGRQRRFAVHRACSAKGVTVKVRFALSSPNPPFLDYVGELLHK